MSNFLLAGMLILFALHPARAEIVAQSNPGAILWKAVESQATITLIGVISTTTTINRLASNAANSGIEAGERYTRMSFECAQNRFDINVRGTGIVARPPPIIRADSQIEEIGFDQVDIILDGQPAFSLDDVWGTYVQVSTRDNVAIHAGKAFRFISKISFRHEHELRLITQTAEHIYKIDADGFYQTNESAILNFKNTCRSYINSSQ